MIRRKNVIAARQEREYMQDVFARAMRVLVSSSGDDVKKRLIGMLRAYVINNNCSLIVTPERPISPEHKLLIRDDCSGNISCIIKEYLSPSYLNTLEGCRDKPKKLYKVDEYEKALQSSVFGQEMSGYESYKQVETSLLVNLVNERIVPDVIRNMKISDFRDFIKKFCYNEFTKYREKEGFVKVFIRENEADFRDMLCNSGVHQAYVDKLIENMQDKGCADSFEFEYKGQLITGPGFSIDHKNPVYCPSDIASYADVNKPSSLALVENTIHRLKHKLELRIIIDDGVFYEKILLPQNCAAMLDFQHYIVHDFDNPNRKVMISSPRGNNFVYLNKIDTFVQGVKVRDEQTRRRDYVNINNGR